MTRRILALGLVVSVLLLGSLGVSTARHSVPLAFADESVQVYPVAGSRYDQFVFSGKGFGRGAILSETYTDPTGDDYSFFDSNGNESLIQAGDDGSWQVTVKPYTDFEGAYAGTWHVSFCLVNTSDCWSGDITITL